MREETTIRSGTGRGTRESAATASAQAATSPAPNVSLLALQFLAWVAARPRTRADVMDAWRSTCPRQSVWEDTVIDGLVRIDTETSAVVLTPLGRAVLAHGAPAANGAG